MKMNKAKKTACLIFSGLIAVTMFFAAVSVSPLQAQENPRAGQTEVEQEKTPPQIEGEAVPARKITVYDPQGRRDPFKNLLGGAEPDIKDEVEGIAQLSVEELMLSGIIEVEGEMIGIIKDPLGFPAYIKEGDRFSDGFVLRIEPTKVILRKTSVRGVPLRKPQDITKELFTEEH